MNYKPKRKIYIWSLLLVLSAVLAGCSINNSRPAGSSNQKTGGVITAVPALPNPEIPAPLGIKSGTVPLDMSVSVGAQAVTDKVQLRFLVIANNPDDWGLATWKAVLDRVGAPYDVFLAETTPLSNSSLIDTDGSGKYSAILLTNSSLLYQSSPGVYVSAFDGIEWNTLWSYERNYRVRQVSLYTAPGTFPEDYCLRPVSEGGVSGTPLNANLTTAGAKIFNDLKTGVVVPITYSYVYNTSIATGTACTGATASAIMTSGSSVLGVTSNTTDGRQRAALTFSSNQYLLQANLLTLGLLRWASKGVFFGEKKNYINVDVDDWFNTADERNPDGTFVPGGFSMSASDAWSTYTIQRSLVAKYRSVLPSFMINVAYNADGADLTAPANGTSGATGCNINQASPDPLTSTTRCLRNDFRFINHTLSHMKLNDPLLATAPVVRTEIRQNIADGNTLGLNITNRTVLKTGEYSGLGVYNPDPNNDIDPPTDYGLMGSNPNLISEAAAYGIKYLHGNMSFKSHQPSCFNCGIYHPMNTSLLVVPDWPTNIAYLATTPAEEEGIYNCFFGPNGTCAGGTLRYWPQDLTYSQIIEYETDLALTHLVTGSVYSHTLHIANLRQYATSKNMVFDWIDRLVGKYAAYYKVPLRNLAWQNLGGYVANRNSHFATLVGVKAVWDRALNTVTVTSASAGSVYLSGATASGVSNESYGGNTTSLASFTAGQTRTFTPAAYVATLSQDVSEVNLQGLEPLDTPVLEEIK